MRFVKNNYMSNFKELGLCEEILKGLSDLGYEKPSEIQEKTIPQILQDSCDVKAFAQTGTGKTAAFSLPIIELLEVKNNNTQALILSPTRELAVQIGENIKQFCKYLKNIQIITVYGGSSIETQIRTLKKGVQIVIGTPGRTVDLIKRNILKLNEIKWLVLDEADEMLNMGFKEDLDQILEATPEEKQTLLFSATFPKEVERIAEKYMNNPIEITAGKKNTGSDNVTHEFYLIIERNRYPALRRIADANPDIYGIIFCRTKRETAEVSEKLMSDGYNADCLHGDLSQAQRDSVMLKFRNKSLQILVATDVAARGLDVNNLTHVINYKLPDQIESYTHRSGRTGRASSKGHSLVLVNKKEKSRLRIIERIIKKKFTQQPIPDGKIICEKQLFSLIEKVKKTEVNTKEIQKYLENIYKEMQNFSKEELIQKFVSVEFNRFLHFYAGARDLNKDNEKSSKYRDENMARFFINLGKKDGLKPANLIGLINDQNIDSRLEIGQIEILDRFSFFEIDKNYIQDLLAAFRGEYFNDRKISVEMTKKKRQNNFRNNRNRKRNFGRKRY